MSFASLSTEVLQKIYDYANLADIVHLAQTSKRNYRAYLGRRISILERGIYNSYGPITELVKLVISEDTEKRTRRPVGTEIRCDALIARILESVNTPKLSLGMMKEMVPYGRVAARWTEIFPQRRWRIGFENRRSLRFHERERLRRAVYNYWIYGNLFHGDTFVQFSPDPLSLTGPEDPRPHLLRTLSTMAMIQLSELVQHISELIELDLYPSDETALRDYGDHLSTNALSKHAWGEGLSYFHLVQALLKYDPKDLLYLIDCTSTKSQKAEYLHGKSPAFRQASATINHALSHVVESERKPTASRGKLDDVVFPSDDGRCSGRNIFFTSADFEDVKFGIVDLEDEKDGGIEREKHVYASDGNNSREWLVRLV